MKLAFPSHEFDEAVTADCHGMSSEEEARALNTLLRSDSPARDEYILRVELHAHLASEPDLFVPAHAEEPARVGGGGFQPAGPRIANSQIAENLDASESHRLLPNAIQRSSRSESVAASQAPRARKRFASWAIAMATCFALLATGWWEFEVWHLHDRTGATSKAVAMLDRVVDAQWDPRVSPPAPGCATGSRLAASRIRFGTNRFLQRRAFGDRRAG